MQAFLNKKEVKEKYINRVKMHQKADEIVKGKYWENGKGCAVGCTIHSSNHNSYETELGIPIWLAYVEDGLFEGMNSEKSKTWPFEFLNAIKVGVDLERVKGPFQIMVLENLLNTLDNNKFCDTNFPEVIESIKNSKKVVQDILELWRNGKINDKSAAWSAAWSADSAAWSADSAARSAADSAARSAASAARSAADSAAWSAASAARSAAWSAAWSADSAARSATRSAADSADSAARSAADSAAWNAAWSAAWSADSAARSATRSAEFDKLADGLLEIIENIK